MAAYRIDIGRITGTPKRMVGIYTPVHSDAYGLSKQWTPFANCTMWITDTSVTAYDSTDGVNPTTTCTIYIGASGRDPPHKDFVALPARVGVQFVDDGPIRVSASVENYYDFDSQLAYTLVVI